MSGALSQSPGNDSTPRPSLARWGVGGGGSFGVWVKDQHGLPAFEYRLDQFTDPRGEWQPRLIPEGGDSSGFVHRLAEYSREDALGRLKTIQGLRPPKNPNTSNVHWHQLGNDRVTAVATNDGWVQVYSHEFGPRWVNMCRPELGSYAGGVSFVNWNGNTVSTLFGSRGDNAEVRRVWGCGYATFEIEQDGVRIERTIFAPFGDSPFLVSSVSMRNLTDRRINLKHLEYWDLHPHTLDPSSFQVWQFDTEQRDQLSQDQFGGYRAAWDSDLGALVAHHPWRQIIREGQDWPGAMQRVRQDVSLIPLGALAAGELITDRQQLFNNRDPYRPSWPDASLVQANWNAPFSDQPILAAATEHSIEPGGVVEIGYAYGATAPVETASDIRRIKGMTAADAFRITCTAWRNFLPVVEIEDDNLSRELAWSAYYVRSGSVYHRTMRAHTLPQGGAYQYLGGVNAGPRATIQHALPFIWMDPELVKDILRFTLAETHPSGEVPYAEVANGLITALRYIPSDNDLWLLWGLADYVLSMRDHQFLREICSYWPAPYTRPETVWEHAIRAFRHNVDEVGRGPHGLARMRTSDWNDAIVREGKVPIDRVWENGESTLNTAMAVHVYRRFAELASFAGDPRLEAEARDLSDQLAQVVRECWRGRHLNRGWRDVDSEVGYSDLYLESQPWALIAEILSPHQQNTLVAEIDERLSDPLGSRIFGSGTEGNPPTAGGGQWLSINSTLVWGLAKVSPKRAWKELKDNLLHNHAETYPDTWSGIWSGPDTYLPATAKRAGETWAWPGVFAMQAWPVQILFPHSEPLNSFLWMAGIEATAAGIRIAPKLPMARWSWRSTHLQLDWDLDRIGGQLTFNSPDWLRLEVVVPESWSGSDLEVIDGAGKRPVRSPPERLPLILNVVGSGSGFSVRRLSQEGRAVGSKSEGRSQP